MYMYLELIVKIRSIIINLFYLFVEKILFRFLLESVKKFVNLLSILVWCCFNGGKKIIKINFF